MRIRSAISIVLAVGFAAGCSAGTADDAATETNTGPGVTVTGQGGGSTTGSGGSTGQFTGGVGGGDGGSGGGVVVNPCGTECGPVELCDGQDQGIDNNCNGTVDENCPCGPGQASSCFKGDPSFLDVPGCLPGTMSCTELGTWGVCTGGKHATSPDNCQLSDPTGCHPISGVPFQTVSLKTGTGTFDDDQQSETFTVTCPTGVTPCPVPTGSNYQALQSGEYTVHYTKTVGGNQSSCDFPLYIGARGLRVELSWNYQSGSTIDLDLHMHQPYPSTLPWKISGATQDCGFSNCTVSGFLPLPSDTDSPSWFPAGNTPPAAVNWYNAPTDPEDLCYYAPRGYGDDWKLGNQGCHSPRLDLDNISCTPSITDPQSSSFCAPENINIDFPPEDQWIRVGVHYYASTSTFSGTVTPELKIYCDGQLAASLGPTGFGNPTAALTFTGPSDEDDVWLAADVIFKKDQCSSLCKVEPLYLNGDATAKTPVILTKTAVEASFGPPYLPIPP